MAARLYAASTVIWMAIGSACAAQTSPTTAQAAPNPTLSPVATTILGSTNAERRQAGVAEVRANARLVEAAQLQAEQIARLQQLQHEIPGATYPTAADRLAAVAYDWRAYGENLAGWQTGAAEAMREWMHSAGHRENILDPTFTELGVGYALDSSGRAYYVQMFGAPR